MKYCPQCNAKYDFDMSFCLEDGTSLKTIDAAPQSEDDREKTIALPQTYISQPTIAVQDNSEKTLNLPQNLLSQTSENDGGKTLVLPEAVVSEPTIAAGNWNNKQTNQAQINQSVPNQAVFAPSQFDYEPRKSNLGLIIGFLTAGLVLIGSAIGAVFYFQNQPTKDLVSANTNLNANKSVQLQMDGSNSNRTVNASQIFGGNSVQENQAASNSNEKPTPKTTATVEITPKTTPTTKTTETSEPTPLKTSTPTPVPTATATPANIPKVVSGGVVNGKATNLVRPAYPPAARAVHASGTVNVQVVIDEDGNVISASAVSGHPLLRQSAEQAARSSKFSPTVLSGQRVKVQGVIVYNFTP